MPECLYCGKSFEPIRIKQWFCCAEHRIAYNNERKVRGHILTPRNESKLQGLANGQEKPVDQMLNEMLDVIMPEPGKPLTEAETKGVNQVMTVGVGKTNVAMGERKATDAQENTGGGKSV